MSQENNHVKVGIGVMIFKDGKVLAGKRKGVLGGGEYAFTGGHLEYMESFEDCARRETLEEAGITIKNVRFLSLGNIKEFSPSHYVGIGIVADWESGEPQVLEPDKRENWDWCDLDSFPEPIFQPAKLMLDAYKEGRIYNDFDK